MRTWILLRGLARERGHWGDFVGQLQKALPCDRLIALDLPGNGVLHRQPSPVRVEAMVEHCRAELGRLGATPPFHLLGLSMGGMVVACWMQHHPTELGGGVLINTSMRPFSPFHHRLRPGAWWPLLGSLASLGPRSAESRILRLTSNLPARQRAVLGAWTALRQAHPVSIANSLRQLLAAARFRAQAQGPDVPVLVLSSQGDRLVDPRCSQALVQRWQCAAATHPLAGHDLTLDAGKWVAAEIARWLGAANRGG